MSDDQKYLIDGSEVHVVEALKEGFIVIRVYENEDGEPYIDDRRIIVPQVFDKPPTERLHEEIKRQNKDLEELSAKRHALWEEVRKLETLKKEQTSEFAKHKKLTRLMDFITGKITHYVEDDWSGPRIIEFKNSTADESTHPRPLRLLSLFGGSKGDLEWKLNQYSDGSGSRTTVVPCTSYEEALSVLMERLNEMMEKGPREDVVKIADKYGIPISDEYRVSVRDMLRERLEDKLSKHDLARKTIEAELASLP